MAISLVLDRTQFPKLKITATASTPQESRAWEGGTFSIVPSSGAPAITLTYLGGVFPFYSYSDSKGRTWTKTSDDGLVAVFETTITL